MNDEIVEEVKDEDDIMDTVHASATEVVAKPRDVEDLAKKAKAKNMTPDEEREIIEENIIGEFTD